MVAVQRGDNARRIRMGGVEAATGRGDVRAVVEQSGGRRQRGRQWNAGVPVRSGDRVLNLFVGPEGNLVRLVGLWWGNQGGVDGRGDSTRS